MIHVDVWGPYRTPTYDRKQYFVTIVDDYSRFSWACLIHSKTEVYSVLKDFLLMINTQFGMKVKVLRSDNGTEFMNSKCNELFASLGIVHQSSCAYTPQQNGVVERKHRHILNTARALRFHANIPISYWGHCVKAAVYLINMIPTTVLQGKSPHEMFYGTKPQLNHLKVFGCLCFVSILPRSDKFAPRAKKGVCMGYAETQKGYRILDLESNTFQVSRDVTFIEEEFPFKTKLNSQQLKPSESVWYQEFSDGAPVSLPHAEPAAVLHDDTLLDHSNEFTDSLDGGEGDQPRTDSDSEAIRNDSDDAEAIDPTDEASTSARHYNP